MKYGKGSSGSKGSGGSKGGGSKGSPKSGGGTPSRVVGELRCTKQVHGTMAQTPSPVGNMKKP